jgi:transcriptional regulator with XRE-family HTH domain
MDFANWLDEERARFGWNRAELARRADLSPSTLSMICSHKRGVGVDACKSLAKALRLPEAEVLRAAGLLAPARDSDPAMEELLGLAGRLPPDDRQDLIDLARAKLDRRDRAKKKTSRAAS